MENKKSHSHEWWLNQISIWKSTDLSIVDYCKNNDLSRHAFHWHLHKEKLDAESEKVSIVPICMDEPTVSSAETLMINDVSVQGNIDTLRKLLGIQI